MFKCILNHKNMLEYRDSSYTIHDFCFLAQVMGNWLNSPFFPHFEVAKIDSSLRLKKLSSLPPPPQTNSHTTLEVPIIFQPFKFPFSSMRRWRILEQSTLFGCLKSFFGKFRFSITQVCIATIMTSPELKKVISQFPRFWRLFILTFDRFFGLFYFLFLGAGHAER